MRRLRLHHAAVREIDGQVDYYNDARPGLGDELQAEVDALLELIQRFPEAAPASKRRNDCRVAVLPRFPFTVAYQLSGDEVVVLALAHTSRKPGYWERRR